MHLPGFTGQEDFVSSELLLQFRRSPKFIRQVPGALASLSDPRVSPLSRQRQFQPLDEPARLRFWRIFPAGRAAQTIPVGQVR
jgi:hypothetical protein